MMEDLRKESENVKDLLDGPAVAPVSAADDTNATSPNIIDTLILDYYSKEETAEPPSESLNVKSEPKIPAPEAYQQCEAPISHPNPPSSETADPPIPNSRESVFKTIMKRLSYLEQNLTLYQQYLEEQSHQFREIFTSLEVYQRKRLNSFLDLMNRTLYTQYETLVRILTYLK